MPPHLPDRPLPLLRALGAPTGLCCPRLCPQAPLGDGDIMAEAAAGGCDIIASLLGAAMSSS